MARPRPAPPVLRTLAIVLCTLACAASAGAQGYQAVHSRDGVDVWAVGDAGAWGRSFDGGATWTTGTLPTARALRGVAHRGLTVLVVADSGQVFRSTDNGVSWTRTVVDGTPDLKAVEMPSASVAVVVGAGETILRSDDGGANWTPHGTGGGATLLGLRMTSDIAGFACGTGGKLLATVDGTTWAPIAVPTANDLFAVDATTSRLWVVGAYGAALRSTTGGASWTAVDLRMETPSDVRAVTLAGANGVTLTGGGGFIRSSGDDGATWTFASHPLIAPTSDYFAYDANKAWAVSWKTKAVIRTANAGFLWQLPTSATTGWDWALKRSAGSSIVRGNTFANSPQNRNSVWAVMGMTVWKSLDRGETWSAVSSITGGGSKTNSFFVSPKDSNLWVAAVGSPDRIARSTNAGASWTTTLTVDFTEYGMPLEMDVDHPDSLVFGPEDGQIHRSTNFGSTWTVVSNPGFRSPCDIVVSPGQPTNVIVGDGVTGSGLAKIWQSENGATSFSDRYTSASSETPTVWSSRLGHPTLFTTNWSSGGLWRSTDGGKNWNQITTVTSAWGGVTSTDDPRLVVYNRYAGSPNYVSTDGGTSFNTSNLSNPGSGYSCWTLDRSTILDMHSAGIYKLGVTYTVPPAAAQAVALSSPNGGESWDAGSVHAVTWSSTNLALVTLEWRGAPTDPWTPIANVDGALGTYAWTLPSVATTQAEVRVRDAGDGAPVDVSNATFTIVNALPLVTITAPNGGEAWQYGSTHSIAWASANIGTVAIDWRASDEDTWKPLAGPLPAASGEWSWLLPAEATATARIRVRETGGAVEDASDAVFAIVVPQYLAFPTPVEFGGVPLFYPQWDTVRIDNAGTAPLAVSLVASDNPAFVPGRTSFIVPAGSYDTLSVTFTPAVPGPDSALFTLTTDDPAGPHTIRLRGTGTETIAVKDPVWTFAFESARPNPFTAETFVRFTLPERTEIALDVFDLSGRRVARLAEGAFAAGPHSVAFRPRTAGDGGGALPAGVYFARFTAGPHTRTQKLLYLAK